MPERGGPTISHAMRELDFLLFASDATLIGIAGWLGERRRRRRPAIDEVGWMPWTTLSVLCLFGGTVLLAIAAAGWIAG